MSEYEREADNWMPEDSTRVATSDEQFRDRRGVRSNGMQSPYQNLFQGMMEQAVQDIHAANFRTTVGLSSNSRWYDNSLRLNACLADAWLRGLSGGRVTFEMACDALHVEPEVMRSAIYRHLDSGTVERLRALPGYQRVLRKV